jgi:hypothetical protein
VKYHIIKTDDNQFLLLFLICEIAVFSLITFIIAYITGHYWSDRFYRGAIVDQYFKLKFSKDSDTEEDEENEEKGK